VDFLRHSSLVFRPALKKLNPINDPGASFTEVKINCFDENE